MKKLLIKSYSNGSYAYYLERTNTYVNIPSELGKAILELQQTNPHNNLHKVNKALLVGIEISRK